MVTAKATATAWATVINIEMVCRRHKQRRVNRCSVLQAVSAGGIQSKLFQLNLKSIFLSLSLSLSLFVCVCEINTTPSKYIYLLIKDYSMSTSIVAARFSGG